MKFVGKPNDYYDHQAYVWGVDEKIVYDRNPFWPAKPPLFEGGQPIFEDGEFKIEEGLRFGHKIDGKDYEFGRFLVVCGKLYPLVYSALDGKIYPSDYIWGQFEVKPEMRWEIYREGHHVWVKRSDRREELWRRRYPHTVFYSWQEPVTRLNVGDEVPALEKLSKLVHQPIFIINSISVNGSGGFRVTTFKVDPHYPVTSEMGLGQFISPDKLYQEVGYWLSNIINPSPDVMPEGKPPQTDVEKAVAHGFDKKVSFRKRKSDLKA